MTRTPEDHRRRRAGGGSRAADGNAQDHALLVVDGERRVVGALNIHDLLRARVV